MKKLIAGVFLAVVAMILFPIVAQATTFSYDLDVRFGAVESEGDGDPWLRATFDDSLVDGDILLTLETQGTIPNDWGIADDEKVKEWYFNFGGDITELEAELLTAGVVDSYSYINTTPPPIKAGGDGTFDFMFSFATSGNTFSGGDTLEFRLYMDDGTDLTLADFQGLWSEESGGEHGPFLSAAHILNTAGGGSDWVAAVPEPTTVLLLGSGLVGLMLYGRKRFRKETDKTS